VVIRSHRSKRDRQYNDQNKKTNNDPQNNTQKPKEAKRQYSGKAVPAPLLAPATNTLINIYIL